MDDKYVPSTRIVREVYGLMREEHIEDAIMRYPPADRQDLVAQRDDHTTLEEALKEIDGLYPEQPSEEDYGNAASWLGEMLHEMFSTFAGNLAKAGIDSWVITQPEGHLIGAGRWYFEKNGKWNKVKHMPTFPGNIYGAVKNWLEYSYFDSRFYLNLARDLTIRVKRGNIETMGYSLAYREGKVILKPKNAARTPVSDFEYPEFIIS